MRDKYSMAVDVSDVAADLGHCNNSIKLASVDVDSHEIKFLSFQVSFQIPSFD